jgi:hypothetical protein
VGTVGLHLAPLLPWPVIAALGALTAAALGLCIVHHAAGTGWRALVAALLLLSLLNPALVREKREPLADVAVILADQSASQGVGERRQRTDAAVAALERQLAELTDLEVRVLRSAGYDSLGETAGDVGQGGTRLFGVLNRALAEVPRRRLAGAILVTDGQVHDVPEDLALGAPLHALLSGRRGEADRRLSVVKAPGYGLVGKELSMTVRIDDSGAAAGERVRLTLRRDGEPVAETLVPIGADHEIDFVLDHGGPTVFELDAAPAARELSLENNHAVISVNGVRDRLRVLLVSGEPHAGERTWRNLLKSDPSVDLVHFTILRPPEKQDGTPIRELSLIAFPIRELFEVKLHEFDLVIFDRYRRRGVLPRAYLRNIAEYVRNGGALLEAVGPTFATPLSLYRTPLGEVLPGEPTGIIFERGYRPAVTAVGRRHPVTADLPGDVGADEPPRWGRWFRQIEVVPVRGNVLMSGVEEQPLLILDRVGEGRVAQLSSDHMWLWARGFDGGGPQAEVLRRIAHWLMKEPELEEDDLRAEVRGGRLHVVRRSLAADAAPVGVTAPSGEARQLSLEEVGGGRATADLAVTEPGIYRVRDGARTVLAAAGALNPLELADLRATAERLEPAVAANGGGAYWLIDGRGEAGLPELRRVRPERRAAGDTWLGLRANGDYRVTGVQQVPLLPALLLLFLALGGLLLAWHREGR